MHVYGTFCHFFIRMNLVLLALLMTFICRGRSLLCYECASSLNSDCGPLFKSHSIKIASCPAEVAVCALQRQRAIREIGQIAAISRTCNQPNRSDLIGLNSSVGCRTWTNDDNFSALFCFCDTDLCNQSPRLHFAVLLPHPPLIPAWSVLVCSSFAVTAIVTKRQ